jgi:hypothetical protein
VALGSYSVAMGFNVIAQGSASFALGDSNATTNNYAIALGQRAKAVHQGSLVWNDATVNDLFSTNNNSVTMRASGGYRLFSNGGASAGVFLAPGSTAWAVISDRNSKKDFAPVNTADVLDKLAAMPITTWRYNWEDEAAPLHLGPMAQDFKASFYPGADDKSITTQEADGVALAAIQGLNQKLQERDARIKDLERRLERLEKLSR